MGSLSESKHIGTHKSHTTRSLYARLGGQHGRVTHHKPSFNEVKILSDKFKRELVADLTFIERRVSAHKLKGKYSKGFPGLVSAVKSVKDKFRSYYKEAYILGTKAAGTSFSTRYHLTAEDLKFIESAFRHEMRYFNKVLDMIKSGTKVSSISRRIGMYADTLMSVFESGLVASQSEDVIINWIVDHGAESCNDCIEIAKYGPFTKDTLPTTPKAGATRCLSNCKCTLDYVPSSKEAADKVRRQNRSRSYVLNRVRSMRR